MGLFLIAEYCRHPETFSDNMDQYGCPGLDQSIAIPYYIASLASHDVSRKGPKQFISIIHVRLDEKRSYIV